MDKKRSDNSKHFNILRCCRLGLCVCVYLCIPLACESAQSQTQQSPPPACEAIAQKERAALREQIRQELREEIRAELRQELIAELSPGIRAQIAAEYEQKHEVAQEFEQNETTESLSPEAQIEDEQQEIKLIPPSGNVEKDEHGLKILRIALSSGVERRQPTDERQIFKISDGAIFCFIEVASVYEDERLLTLRWTHTSGISQSYEMPIGQSPAWRTWSKLNLTQAMVGSWNCEIFNEDGILLASASFYVQN